VAKAGIEMLTKQMALELAPHRIRVNAIAPGLIETDLNRSDIQDPEFRERRLARIPLKEIGVPEDVVGAVVFLASNEEARLVTGASVFIDAGQTIWGA
jgi:NAD(P)-dependent dehydrogenase (short-subunit alcohol dehydrogenase family)